MVHFILVVLFSALARAAFGEISGLLGHSAWALSYGVWVQVKDATVTLWDARNTNAVQLCGDG
jgi:hypothetical protein